MFEQLYITLTIKKSVQYGKLNVTLFQRQL